jgi:hypothetical protein
MVKLTSSGDFGHVPSVRRANEYGLNWIISRARLSVLRKHYDNVASSVKIIHATRQSDLPKKREISVSRDATRYAS